MSQAPCDLCEGDGGELLFRNEHLRVVAVTGAEGNAFTGFCRVVWNAHVKELTDLSADDRTRLMAVVFRVESALREALQPDKINLASLGNLTPHVHWHVIPRFANDAAFPKPIWAVSLGDDSVDAVHSRTIPSSAVPPARWKEAVRRALSTD